MSGKEDIRSWAGLPSHKDRLTGQIYEPDKHGRGHEHLIRSLRKGSVVEVVDLMWLAVPGRADKRRRSLEKNIQAILDKHCVIREISTGNEAPRNLARMFRRAYEMIGRAGRGLRSAENGKLSKGRPRKPLTPQQREAIERIWLGRRYKTGREALAAIHALGIRVSTGWLYTNIGKRD